MRADDDRRRGRIGAGDDQLDVVELAVEHPLLLLVPAVGASGVVRAASDFVDPSDLDRVGERLRADPSVSGRQSSELPLDDPSGTVELRPPPVAPIERDRLDAGSQALRALDALPAHVRRLVRLANRHVDAVLGESRQRPAASRTADEEQHESDRPPAARLAPARFSHGPPRA